MTNAQLKVLRLLDERGPQVASEVGVAICGENCPNSDVPRSRQGLGRIGGNTLRKLQDAGYVAWTWPVYRLTGAGQSAMRAAGGGPADGV